LGILSIPEAGCLETCGREVNRAGETSKKLGIQFAYHNHDFEFTPLNGRLPYHILLAETDPELVKMEMDLYWITKGGQDPVEYFDRHPGRFPLVHVKDMDQNGEIADVGSGTIDFARIFARSEGAGVETQADAFKHESARAFAEAAGGLMPVQPADSWAAPEPCTPADARSRMAPEGQPDPGRRCPGNSTDRRDRYHPLALGTLGLPNGCLSNARGTCIASARRRRAGNE